MKKTPSIHQPEVQTMFNQLKKNLSYRLRKLNWALRRRLAEISFRNTSDSDYGDDDWLVCPCSQCYMDRWDTFVGDRLNPDRD
jgi:hypothetical protein